MVQKERVSTVTKMARYINNNMDIIFELFDSSDEEENVIVPQPLEPPILHNNNDGNM